MYSYTNARTGVIAREVYVSDASFASNAERHFPANIPHGCPPDEAPMASGEVFRIVKTNPPTPDDFLTYIEQGKLLEERECDCHGISVFRDPDHAAFYADKFPALGEFIARGSLDVGHGKLGDTPRNVAGTVISHATWWPFEGIARHTLFVVPDEE